MVSIGSTLATQFEWSVNDVNSPSTVHYLCIIYVNPFTLQRPARSAMDSSLEQNDIFLQIWPNNCPKSFVLI
jgi:hypothetical protein